MKKANPAIPCHQRDCEVCIFLYFFLHSGFFTDFQDSFRCSRVFPFAAKMPAATPNIPIIAIIPIIHPCVILSAAAAIVSPNPLFLPL